MEGFEYPQYVATLHMALGVDQSLVGSHDV